MVRGLYTSALGMITNMQRMDVITNNMANADTTSFKRDHVVSHQFSELMMNRLNDPWNMPGVRWFKASPIGPVAPGVFIDDVFTDWTQGSMRQTGANLDIALQGQGFFVVNHNGEQLFTRDGSFTSFDGMLLTAEGGRVQGLNGDIVLPDGIPVLSETGRIYVNGEYVDTLLLTTFTDLHSLRKMEDNFFRTTEHSVRAAFEGRVHQGFLENSNANIVSEMVQMIALSRAFETNARILSVQDQTLQRAVNDIART
ncbi:MAG: flagellar hook-basal body protein [Defluviitaleaceae bacterium]|nr:flagellar hook-basal body protein [Defluviitaleaceae bacterium]MCL2239035.1 flagellar hook-basal body protein [Defluviitaleaceae bacterium]